MHLARVRVLKRDERFFGFTLNFDAFSPCEGIETLFINSSCHLLRCI